MGTVSERDRVLLRMWADEHMDGQTADAFMNSTAPAGWDDFPTKSDLAAVKSDVAAVKSDVAAVKSDVAAVKSDVAEVQSDVAALKVDVVAVKSDIAAVRADIERNREATEHAITQWREVHEKSMENLGARLTAVFTAQLATEIGKVHEKVADLSRGQRSQTITLIVMILVAFFSQSALPHLIPPPAPPPIVIQLPGEQAPGA